MEVELCASSVSSYVSRRQCVVVYGGGRCSSGGEKEPRGGSVRVPS